MRSVKMKLAPPPFVFWCIHSHRHGRAPSEVPFHHDQVSNNGIPPTAPGCLSHLHVVLFLEAASFVLFLLILLTAIGHMIVNVQTCKRHLLAAVWFVLELALFLCGLHTYGLRLIHPQTRTLLHGSCDRSCCSRFSGFIQRSVALVILRFLHVKEYLCVGLLAARSVLQCSFTSTKGALLSFTISWCWMRCKLREVGTAVRSSHHPVLLWTFSSSLQTASLRLTCISIGDTIPVWS